MLRLCGNFVTKYDFLYILQRRVQNVNEDCTFKSNLFPKSYFFGIISLHNYINCVYILLYVLVCVVLTASFTNFDFTQKSSKNCKSEMIRLLLIKIQFIAGNW